MPTLSSRSRLAANTVIFLLALVLVAGRSGLPLTWTGRLKDIQPHEGFSYYAQNLIGPPWDLVFDTQGDTPRTPVASALRLFEDGKLLPYPHSDHATIAAAGEGRYSNWGDSLVFSASDNSDPRANTRSYTIEYPPRLNRPAFYTPFAIILIAGVVINFERIRRYSRARARRSAVAAAEGVPAVAPGPTAVSAAAAAARSPSIGKQLAFTVLFLLILINFSIGLVISADMIWRIVDRPGLTGLGIDLAVFSYADYVVTTHPQNLAAGHGNSPMDQYFPDKTCAAPDGTTARFNSLGFRSPEFVNLPPKQQDEVRVIITGGSVSESFNVSETCTLDADLLQLLSERIPGKTIKIYNMGSGAWKSLQELIAIERYGIDINPDLIIAFDGFNDIEHSYNSGIEVPYAGWRMAEAYARFRDWAWGGPLTSFQGVILFREFPQVLNRLSFGLLGSARAAALEQTVISSNPLASSLQLPIDRKRIAQMTGFDPQNRRAVDTYLRNMDLMNVVAQTAGSQILYALQPMLYLKESLSDAEREKVNGYRDEVNYSVLGYMRIEQGLSKLVKRRSYGRFLDLSAPFQDDPTTYFYDYAHINSAGYRIIAVQISDVATDMLSHSQIR